MWLEQQQQHEQQEQETVDHLFSSLASNAVDENETGGFPPGKLQSLQPVPLLPDKSSPNVDLLAKLHKIEAIQVYEDRTKSGYVVDVWLMQQPTSHIPTNHRLPPCLVGSDSRCKENLGLKCDRPPDFHALHSFADFRLLCTKIYYEAYISHGQHPCDFCAQVVDFLIMSKSYPTRWKKWFHSPAKLTQGLRGFLIDVLTLAITHSNRLSVRSCPTRKHLPEYLSDFLFTCESDNANANTNGTDN